jgi:PTS system cellobiose-specific IIC component
MLEKIMNKIAEPLTKVAAFLQTNRYTSAIINGLTVTIPVTIVGALATLITAAPNPDAVTKPGNIFYGILSAWFNAAKGGLGTAAAFLNNVSLNMVSVFALLAITYNLARSFKHNVVLDMITSFMCFVCVACSFDGGLSTGFLGGRGLFCAFLVACLSTTITELFNKAGFKIKLPEQVPPNVSAPFEALIPMFVNVCLFYAINAAFVALNGNNLATNILNLMKPLISTTDTLGAALVYGLLLNGLWIVGVHGGNVCNSVMSAFFLMNLTANAEAAAAGQPLPHILATNWNTIGLNLGGSGCGCALALSMLIVAKSAHLRTMVKVGGPAVIFNITEPLVFGTPIVLNPYLVVPFVCVPLLNTVILFLLMQANVLGRIRINAPWVLPGPIFWFLSTLDFKMVIAWFVLLAIDTVIYIPFMKMYDNSLLAQEKEG